MTNDAFSKCHPAVNFVFFLGAIGLGVVIQHPVYLLLGVLGAAVYYLLLAGNKGWKMIFGLVPVLLLVMAINPLFNTRGENLLFTLFGRPYTLEALLYGGAVAAVLAVTLLWFGCYNRVLTGDKFTSLFGNRIPGLSLLLVMVFRMVPNLLKKATQIRGARQAIGKTAGEESGIKGKLKSAATIMGALTTWALEGSIVTGDSMRARGYGTAKRSSFRIYHFGLRDALLLASMVALLALTVLAMVWGQTDALYTPGIWIAPVSWGIVPYGIFLLIPTILHIKEAVQWHISRSKI